MATDDADAAPRELEGEVQEAPTEPRPAAAVGEYTWDDFLRERGESAAADALYQRFDEAPGSERWGETETTLRKEDWDRTDIDPATYLGFPPWEFDARIGAAHRVAEEITESSPLVGYDQTPVIKDIYGWEDYKREYFYTDEGEPPTDSDGEPEAFDASEPLGFDPAGIGAVMADHERAGEDLKQLVDERTVDVMEEVDEDAFFSDEKGRTTVANRYDLEKTVPASKKSHFREEDRYWVNEPYSFVVIFHSTKENEKKYYVVEPNLTEIEEEVQDYISDKLRAAIKYEQEGQTAGDESHRRSVIEDQTRELLNRYDLYDEPDEGDERGGLGNTVAEKFDLDPSTGLSGRVVDLLGYEEPIEGVRELEGIEARPEPVLVEENADTLNEYQVEKLLYYLERDFIGYERIDGIKHDINVEDISCDGYNTPVFVYHSQHDSIISNIYHGEEELDDFVVKMAQRSGKGISKRRPQVDATLPDGSRAQLTLGREVSDKGTNYTIRQFVEIPFTPIDQIAWGSFSLNEMAFLWLCIENDKSMIIAGGTATGKTTLLNAVSLFIPSSSKIVSIEDTREVELPQRNWIASVTRPSFTDDEKGDIDEFDLLEAALRQRPEYIVMGEVRGEEGKDLFQVMSTGHTSYSTFHADSVGEVLKRFTTEPINVSKTMFTALDLVSIQTRTRVGGNRVIRNKGITEINHYDAENDEINVKDVFQWQAETDEFLQMGDSSTLDEIMFDRGWDRERLDEEIFKRQTVLSYLIDNGLNTYTQVAATFQAFINDPETILTLMANDNLERSLEDLREMESVYIDVDPEDEERVPRPEPGEDILAEAAEILERAEEEIFEDLRGAVPDSVASAMVDTEPAEDIEVTEEMAAELTEGTGTDAEPEVPSASEETALDEGTSGRSAIGDVDQQDLDEEDETPALAPADQDEADDSQSDSAGTSAASSGELSDIESSDSKVDGEPNGTSDIHGDESRDSDGTDEADSESETGSGSDDGSVLDPTVSDEPVDGNGEEVAANGSGETRFSDTTTPSETAAEEESSEKTVQGEPDEESEAGDPTPDQGSDQTDHDDSLTAGGIGDVPTDEELDKQEKSTGDTDDGFSDDITITDSEGSGPEDQETQTLGDDPFDGAATGSENESEPTLLGDDPQGTENSVDGGASGDSGDDGTGDDESEDGVWGAGDEDWDEIAAELESDGDDNTADVDSWGLGGDTEEE
jgi:flagellar protein FlaI